MKQHLHFMGIGGVSMSGLALWYAANGYEVSGCDINPSPIIDTLLAAGIPVQLGHHSKHLANVDTVISSMAISKHEPEWQTAKVKGLKTLKRIELLADLFGKHKSIGITGTHGKSTTTAMVATIFLNCQTDPTIQVGAYLPEIAGNSSLGKGPYLVAEVDESDPGFAKLKADTAIITNLEDDHIAGDFEERRNYHASLADLEAAALCYASQARQVLYFSDWASLRSLLKDLPQAVTYGYRAEANYLICNERLGEGSSQFDFQVPGGENFAVTLSVPGAHNVQNAAAALATAHLYGLEMEKASAALAAFNGVGRRWQRWGTITGALIIDDYAHHPTEIKATLTAAKHTGRRVRAVLQPHRWVRTARHWPALADAVSLADEILVLDIYSAGETAIPGISSQLIIDRLHEAGKKTSYHSLASAQSYLAKSLQPNDLIITLGAGDVWRIAAGLVEQAEHESA